MASVEILSDAEVRTLIMATVRGMDGPTEEDFERVVEWARQVRIDCALLLGVLDGGVAVRWDDTLPGPRFWRDIQP